MKCKLCGKSIDDNCLFCPYCGEKNKKEYNQNILETNSNRKKNKKVYFLLGLLAFLLIGIIGIFIINSGSLTFLFEDNKKIYKIPSSIIKTINGETEKTYYEIDFDKKTMLWNQNKKTDYQYFETNDKGYICSLYNADKSFNECFDYDENGYLIGFGDKNQIENKEHYKEGYTKINWSNNYKTAVTDYKADGYISKADNKFEFDVNGNVIKGICDSAHFGKNFEEECDKYNNYIKERKNIKYTNKLLTQYDYEEDICIDEQMQTKIGNCKIKYEGIYPKEFLYSNGDKIIINYTNVNKKQYNTFLKFSLYRLIWSYGYVYPVNYNFLKPID